MTAIEKEGRAALEEPSLTEITMPEYVPTFAAVGVPDSMPLVVLNVAQVGLFCTLKLNAPPLGSLVDGVKLYAEPAVTLVAGVPLMLGPAGAVTEMLNGARAAEAVPSLAVMMMLLYVPSCAVVGVPVRAPLAMLNAAQEGLFWMENDSDLPAGSDAVG